jgi:hypothetical protein
VGVVVTMNLIAGKKPATTKSLMFNLEQYQTKEILIANGTRAACSEEFRDRTFPMAHRVRAVAFSRLLKDLEPLRS